MRKYWFLALIIAALNSAIILTYLNNAPLKEGVPLVGFAELVELCGLITALGVGVLALLPTLDALSHQVKESAQITKSGHYAELDAIFLQLLSMAIDKPYLRVPSKAIKEHPGEYETYAFVVFNFLETLRDRSKDDEELRRTWGPVIISEALLHWDWFERETNCGERLKQPKFCHQFSDFMHRHKEDDFWDLSNSEQERCKRYFSYHPRGGIYSDTDKNLRQESSNWADRRCPNYDPWRYREEKFLHRAPFLPGRASNEADDIDGEVKRPWFCKG